MEFELDEPYEPYRYDITPQKDEDKEEKADSENGFLESSEEDDDKTEYDGGDPGTKMNLMKEVDSFIVLRSNLEELEEEQARKQFGVQTTREELLTSKNRLEVLNEELKKNQNELEIAKKNKNTARCGFLLAQQHRIEVEIKGETDLQAEIDQDLKAVELSQLRSDLNYQQMLDLARQVRNKEEIILVEKHRMAEVREEKLRQREKLAENKWKKAEMEMKQQMQLEQQMREKALLGMANANARNKPFVQQTAFNLKTKRIESERRKQEMSGNKMDDVIKLKNKIEEGRENIKAIQAKKRAVQQKKIEKNKQEVDELVKKHGGNPTVILRERKMKEEYERQARKFEKKQQENKVKIVDRLLDEEKNYEKRKKLYPYLFEDSRHKPTVDEKKKPKSQHFLDKELGDLAFDQNGEPILTSQRKKNNKTTAKPQQYHNQYEVEETRGFSSSSNSSDDEVTEEESSNMSHQRHHSHMTSSHEVSLARPEFEGMWGEDHEPYKVAVEAKEQKPLGGSILEKEILKRNLDVQRGKIFQKQVAGGREFKGQAFTSKPDVIHFKDLVVGETYKKRIQITNVSYTINFCKYVDISHHLKDFISIQFSPPGAMSAGMTCELHATFKPMINKDLEGELFFQAQTGHFTIPIKCTIKKCQLSVDLCEIDFGKEIVGETASKSITLHNKGALATDYKFFAISDKHRTSPSLDVSLGELTDDESETSECPRKILDAAGDQNVVSKEEEHARGGRRLSSAMDDDVLSKEIKVGEKSEGRIEAFSSIQLQLIFTPTIPGSIHQVFRIQFQQDQSQNIDVQVSGVCINIPVWLERKEVDLKICTFNRLYQDQIVVRNRAKYALKLIFEVPKQLKDHLELLPKTGYIQSKSSFTAQLKFLPRSSLVEDAGDLFDPELGVLQAPMTIRVADQSRPISFVLNAIVTSSNLYFDEKVVDFGTCNIYEEVTRSVNLTNESILPQNFGFVDIPDFMDIQPNDGFGKILPQETLKLDLIMKLTKSREYDVVLTCKSEINRNFEIRCRAVGVHPPLCLSHQIVKFAATALYDVRSEVFDVINSHTDANEFTHPVPRIGKGVIAPVGPTSFEFLPPPSAPFNLYPLVGTVEPGEKCQVTVEFSPKLSVQDIRKEAVLMIEHAREENKKELQVIASTDSHKSTKKTSKTTHPECNAPVEIAKDPPPPKTPEEMIVVDSPEYISAMTSLMQKFEGKFSTYSVPCVIGSGRCSTESNQELDYNPSNTIYVQVYCPVIRPPIMVISNGGQRKTNFGKVSIGLKTIETISVLNISSESVKLTSSLLDVCGPFHIVNACREIQPGETHSIKLSFSPQNGQIYQENLKIYCKKSTLDVMLVGEGVSPLIKLRPPKHCHRFDDIVAGERITDNFTFINKSSLAVDFQVIMASSQENQRSPDTGIQNVGGSDVFECNPCSGKIEPGETCDIKVSFQPDHASLYFRDVMKTIMFGNQVAHVMRLGGRSHDHMMFVRGDDPLDVEVDSFQHSRYSAKADVDAPTMVFRQMLLTFVSHSEGNQLKKSERILEIGCIKSAKFASKKSIESIVEGHQDALSQGFSFDTLKLSVEAGALKKLTISWKPTTKQQKTLSTVNSSFNLTLKGNVNMVYQVTLSGSFSFE